MKKIILFCLVAASTMLLTAKEGFSYSAYGNDVNAICAPAAPFTGDCTLCHASSKSTPTPAKTAYLAGGSTLTDYFCPSGTTCTDSDNDTFAIEGGDCGPVDCNDNDPAINPGAAEICTDNVDNDCDGLIDVADSNAVGCPPACTDNDGDGYAVEGGTCGPVDCNDQDAGINPGASDIPNNGIDENCSGADSIDPTILDRDGDGYTPAQGDCNDNNPQVNPGAVDIPNNGIDENCDGQDNVDSSIVDNDGDGFTPAAGDCNDSDAAVNPSALENCTDGIDNNCDGLIDSQAPDAVDCPADCTDSDLDGYATEGGACGQVDCNDQDPTVNPGGVEICGDNIDNDCDTLIDEGCDAACPDLDGDGYLDAACGGNDCDDNNQAVNPGAAEVCGDGIDQNCNGAGDEECQTCPDGTLLAIKSVTYDRGDSELTVRGMANVGTDIAIADGETGAILADNVAVRHGKWQAEIENIDQLPTSITVSNDSGCFTEQQLAPKSEDHRRNDYHQRNGGEHDGYRAFRRESRHHD